MNKTLPAEMVYKWEEMHKTPFYLCTLGTLRHVALGLIQLNESECFTSVLGVWLTFMVSCLLFCNFPQSWFLFIM